MTSVNQLKCFDPIINVPISVPTSQNPTATSWNQHQHPRINPDPVPTSRNQPAAMSQNQPMGMLEPSTDISKLTEMSQNQPRHLETHCLNPNASNLEPNVNTLNTGIWTWLMILVQCQYLKLNTDISNPTSGKQILAIGRQFLDRNL
jgi:hypothetical protein